METATEVLKLKYLKARISYEGLYRKERFPLPMTALREAILTELAPTPLAWLEEAAPDIDLPSDVGWGFLRLSKAYEREAGEARRLGWPTLRRDLHHLAMTTHPEEVTAGMLALTRVLGLKAA